MTSAQKGSEESQNKEEFFHGLISERSWGGRRSRSICSKSSKGSPTTLEKLPWISVMKASSCWRAYAPAFSLPGVGAEIAVNLLRGKLGHGQRGRVVFEEGGSSGGGYQGQSGNDLVSGSRESGQDLAGVFAVAGLSDDALAEGYEGVGAENECLI